MNTTLRLLLSNILSAALQLAHQFAHHFLTAFLTTNIRFWFVSFMAFSKNSDRHTLVNKLLGALAF